MSDDHKAAIAEGRVQSRAVSRYLDALAANKPKRGRQRTVASIQGRIDAIDAGLESADPLKRLNLLQERKDLEAELVTKQATIDVSAYEADFVANAKEYGERKGISYAVWRETGVPAAVLAKAGITRGA